jgi:hypothetical protein
MWIHAFAVSSVVALAGLAGIVEIPVRAQGAQRPAPAAATPAPGGDVKTVLHDWANHMGMLREITEHDLIATLEYLGGGSVNVGGQPCALTKYRVTINYQMSGMRAEIACTRAGGQKHEEIQVVGGQYAWNEVGMPGGGLVPGQGAANAAMEAYAERAIRLWSGPQGAVKAAAMGGPNTKVGVENGKTTVTYPIPGVAGAIAKATLTSGAVDGLCTRNCAERVEVRHGATVTEFTYSNYGDYNDPEEQLDAFFPGRIVEKRGGTTVLDVNVTRTNTPNLYIVIPVPPGVRNAAAAAPQK